MFEQLFGSKTRVKLMQLFLENPEQTFYVRELTRLTGCLINSVRRELDNLAQMNFIIITEDRLKPEAPDTRTQKLLNPKKFYRLNANNIFQADLIKMFAKGKIMMEKKLAERLNKLGELKYLSLGGYFVDDDRATTDILVSGDFDKEKALAVFAEFEKEIEHSLRFTILEPKEFTLRRDIADKFLKDILENQENIVFIDKLSRKGKVSRK